MSAHTPGPWTVETRARMSRVFAGDERRLENEICCIFDSTPHHEANARLIAAAPELLAALEAVVRAFERVGGPLAVEPAMRQARVAIAKAESR